VPLADVNKKIPGVVSNIVCKCLEKDSQLRYQSAEGLVADLRAWQGARGRSRVSASSTRLRMNRLRELPWLRIVITAVLIAVTATGIALYLGRRQQQAPKAEAHAPVSVLVADFQNNTGDSLFDDTLEPMFNVALEGASFINAFSRGTARKAASGLSNSTEKLDEKTSRLIAVKEGIAAIVSGSLNKHGTGYSLSVKAIDAVTGKTLATADVNTANKDALLLEVPKLAVPIRKALGDTTPESVQLAATQGAFTASNLEAVHEYGIAMELQASGKLEKALQAFSKAAELDPKFARAYAGMATTAGNLGQMENAEKYAKLAMEHVDRMTTTSDPRTGNSASRKTANWCRSTLRTILD
jgi:tetratricopeptide (TPR) repeat protein